MERIVEFSKMLAAHGLSLTGQIVVLVAIALWILLAVWKPKKSSLSLALPVLGPAERQAFAEIFYMVAIVCLVIVFALTLSYALKLSARVVRVAIWRYRAQRHLSREWQREFERKSRVRNNDSKG
jgi:magnesium-transporting ATPase (P-type)